MTAPIQGIDVAPHKMYPDRGCDLAPACLKCPLPVCRYDMPRGTNRRMLESQALAIRIREMRRETKLSVPALALKFDVGKGIVQRALYKRGSQAA